MHKYLQFTSFSSGGRLNKFRNLISISLNLMLSMDSVHHITSNYIKLHQITSEVNKLFKEKLFHKGNY